MQNPKRVAGGAAYWICLGTVWLAMILPFAVLPHVALLDAPNHMARVVQIMRLLDGDPFVSRYYALIGFQTSYIIMDWLLIPVTGLFGIVAAMKTFICLTCAIWVYGCHRLGAAIHGSATWMAVPAALFFYMPFLQFGYLGFVLACALTWLSFSYWLTWHKSWTARQLLAASALVCLTYMAHPAGIAFFTGMAGWVLLWEWVAEKKLRWLGLVPLLPTVAVAVISSFLIRPYISSSTMQLTWMNPAELLRHAAFLLEGPGGNGRRPIIAAVAIGLLLLIPLRPAMQRMMVALAAAFGIMFAVSPFATGAINGSDINLRFQVPAWTLALLAVSVVRWTPGIAVAVGLITAGLSIRLALCVASLSAVQSDVGRAIELIDTIPERSKVFPIMWLRRDERGTRALHLFHVANYAVIRRKAVTGSTFAIPGINTIRAKPELNFQDIPVDTPVTAVDWEKVYAYDVVTATGLPAEYKERLAARFTLAGQSPQLEIYLRNKP